MLRAVVKQEIYDLLENTYFGSSNFDVTFKDTEQTQTIFEVTFLGDSRFKFVANKLYNSGDKFLTGESPGLNFLTIEDFKCKDLDMVYSRLKYWTNRVRDELLASNPLAKEVSTLREQLEEHLADLGLGRRQMTSSPKTKPLNLRNV